MKFRGLRWSGIFFWFLLLSCQSVPITGRRQLNLVSSEQIQAMSLDQYRDFLLKHTG
ncbi:MAG: hypothetical protein ACOWYE_03155 [Desulfatiglandales bacterium]